MSYLIINLSVDYMELPALFSILKIAFQFGGHFLFPPISNTSFGKIHCENIFQSPRLDIVRLVLTFTIGNLV